MNQQHYGILEGFLEVVRDLGLQGAKVYAKQLGSEGRIVFNAIGLAESGRYIRNSKKPIHQLARKIDEAVKVYEKNCRLDQLVTLILEGR